MSFVKIVDGFSTIYVNPDRVAWVQPVKYAHNHARKGEPFTRIWFSATEGDENYIQVDAEISAVVSALSSAP
jgi:hypothetical protein